MAYPTGLPAGLARKRRRINLGDALSADYEVALRSEAWVGPEVHAEHLVTRRDRHLRCLFAERAHVDGAPTNWVVTRARQQSCPEQSSGLPRKSSRLSGRVSHAHDHIHRRAAIGLAGTADECN